MCRAVESFSFSLNKKEYFSEELSYRVVAVELQWCNQERKYFYMKH